MQKQNECGLCRQNIWVIYRFSLIFSYYVDSEVEWPRGSLSFILLVDFIRQF